MRVAYFSQGITPHDRRFLSALVKSGQKTFFLHLDGGEAGKSAPLPAGVNEVEWRGDGRHASCLSAARAAGAALRGLAADVVHAGPVQGPALLSALAGAHPLLTMSWGSDLLHDAQAGPGRRAAEFTLRRSDAFTGDCEAVRRQAEELGMDPARIVVFPWGVDLEHFAPAGEDLRAALGWEEGFVLLSARAWEPLYDVEVIVEAFIHASPQRDDLRLLLLGEGSRGPFLKAALEQAGLLDRVHFVGRVGLEDLPRHYRTADLYVSASRSDGSSVSLLEAMACGRAAAVSDIPANREWVEPRRTGWRFPVGDSASLAGCILEAAGDPETLRAYGRAARETAEARADWSRNFPQLLRAYELAMRAAGAR